MSRLEVPRDMSAYPQTIWYRKPSHHAQTEPDRFIFVAHGWYGPTNEYDALMRCAPLEEPDYTEADDSRLDVLETLGRDEMVMYDLLFCEQLSLRQVARLSGLPKTTIARYRDRICKSLQERLAA